MDLSVVVPCFNEESSLPRLYSALTGVLRPLGWNYELIVIDDGSTDATVVEARRIAAADHRVNYLVLSRNFGKEAAMLAGLRQARGQRVVVMDADLQHPPELLPEMLRRVDDGYDQVVARRGREGESWWRAGLSRLYYWLLSRISDVRFRDGEGDFRALSRTAVDAVLSLGEYRRFSKGLLSWVGFPTLVLPYRNVPRQAGKPAWTLAKLVRYATDGLIAFSTTPLRLAWWTGLLLTTITLCALVFLGAKVLTGIGISGDAVVLVLVSGVGGLNMLFLGIHGAYLGRMYEEVRRRPHYLVKEASADVASRKIPLGAREIPCVDNSPVQLAHHGLVGQCDG